MTELRTLLVQAGTVVGGIMLYLVGVTMAWAWGLLLAFENQCIDPYCKWAHAAPELFLLVSWVITFVLFTVLFLVVALGDRGDYAAEVSSAE